MAEVDAFACSDASVGGFFAGARTEDGTKTRRTPLPSIAPVPAARLLARPPPALPQPHGQKEKTASARW